jgi:hypothetical protein
MIRYKLDSNDLQEIQKNHSAWFAKATKHTKEVVSLGSFGDAPGIWSEIKPVFLGLQHHKCAYCERKFSKWPIEWDVEHFRPKNGVEAWSNPELQFPLGDALPEGYYALAYQFGNYLLSCKPCNSTLKHSFFPIAGHRGPITGKPLEQVASYAEEKPYLVYPIGESDTDPEELITFTGVIPRIVDGDPDSHAYKRAEVAIALFQLAKREELLQERAAKIVRLYQALIHNTEKDAQKIINNEQKVGSDHTNCGRAFVRLYQANPELAGEIYQYAWEYYDGYCK